VDGESQRHTTGGETVLNVLYSTGQRLANIIILLLSAIRKHATRCRPPPPPHIHSDRTVSVGGKLQFYRALAAPDTVNSHDGIQSGRARKQVPIH